MTWLNFAAALSEELHRQCVNQNAHANEAYAYWLVSNRAEEDAAWAECQRTARLAEEALEARMDVEDIVATRLVAEKFAHGRNAA